MSKRWPMTRLGEVVRLDLDRIPIDPTAAYPMVGVLSFGRGLFEREPVESGRTSYKYFYRLKAEHVVLSQLFGWEGAIALSSKKFEGKFLSPQFPTFVCDTNKLDREFLGWLIRRPTLWQDLRSRSSGMGDRRRTLSPEAFLSCKVPLPPLLEQARIATRLDKVAAEISNAELLQQQSAKEVEGLSAAFLSSLLPADAKTKPLGELVAPDLPISYGVLVPGPHVEDGVPFVRIQDLDLKRAAQQPNKRIAPAVDAQYQRTRLRGGEILIGVVGSIGKVGIAPPSWAGANIARAVCRIAPGPAVDRDFLALVLSAKPAQDYFRKTTRTLAQPTLNIGQLAQTPIPLPGLAEQHRILASQRALEEVVESLNQLQAGAAAELGALLPAILDAALKGEL